MVMMELARSQIKQEDGIFLRWLVGRYVREYKRYL
jgi:hypothetical protein